ncbi:Phage protein [Vibrio crassostreae]|nr:Phage protein [Vibrio crassostreae]CAK2335525.1 Phage protein [Vibrio crassostreae]CAK2504019.1 Phage protein [Vibrio crassostreae]CAK2909288.1 Phage protein [Vibrio crassostreae]
MRITTKHIDALIDAANRHMPSAQLVRSSGNGKHQIDMKVGNTGAQSHLSGVGSTKETYEFMNGFIECLNLQQYVGHKLVSIM